MNDQLFIFYLHYDFLCIIIQLIIIQLVFLNKNNKTQYAICIINNINSFKVPFPTGKLASLQA